MDGVGASDPGPFPALDGTLFKHLDDAAEWESGTTLVGRDGKPYFAQAPRLLRGLSRSFDELYFELTGQRAITTGFLRRLREQDSIYAKHPGYAEKPWDSPHQFGNALDKRTCGAPMRGQIIAALNEQFIYDPARPRLKCVLHHNVGAGEHFHLQVCHATIVRSASEGRT